MSLQWTFIAAFLYTEIFCCILLLLPIISAYRWSRIFNSRLLNSFRWHANIYFNIFIVVLLVLFFDAVKDTYKYMRVHTTQIPPGAVEASRTTNDMKMFRSQRNLYICGFAILLWLVLRRLVVLMCQQATLEAQVQAITKQAESATATAKKMMEDLENKDNEKEEKTADAAELADTKTELTKANQEVERLKKNLDAMKKQAEATNTEYDRLTSEHSQLQKQLDKLKGEEGKKKEN